MSDIDYEALASTGFAGLSRKQLEEACAVFNIKFHPNSGDDLLRGRLCDAAGAVAPTGPVVVPVVPKAVRGLGEMPNVTPVGRWGGRRYDVTVFAPSGETAKYLPIGWEGDPLYVKFGELTHLPEPHYHSLNNAKLRSFTVKSEKSGEGVRRSEEHVEQLAYPFTFHGITPGTEHLPGSMLEWYQWRADAKDNFAKSTFQYLEQVYGELVNAAPKEGWDREKLRYEVLKFLGPEYAKKAFKEDIEDAA